MLVINHTAKAQTGDVNNDGIVNVADIFKIVNYVMGDSQIMFNDKVTDVNGDYAIKFFD